MCTNMGGNRLSVGSLKNGFDGKWFGVEVISNGGRKTQYFFKQENGTTLIRKGLQAAPTKSPITAQKFVENAKKNNKNVEIISPTDTKLRIDKRNKEMSEKPDYEMGIKTPWGNKGNREAARRSRLQTRTSKKKR